MDNPDFSSPTVQASYERLYLLESIIDISKEILSASKFQDLFYLISSLPSAFPYWGAAFLYILDDDQKYAVLRAGTNAPILVERGYKVPIDASTLVGWCILNNEAKIKASEDNPSPLFPPAHSVMVLPLCTKEGKMIGAVEIFTMRDTLRQEDLPDFKIMADFITFAILNLRE